MKLSKSRVNLNKVLLFPLVVILFATSVYAKGSVKIQNVQYNSLQSELFIKGKLTSATNEETIRIFDDLKNDLIAEIPLRKKQFEAIIPLAGDVACRIRIDSIGASATKGVKFAPIDCSHYKFTINGRVTDSPIENALVSISIGNQSVATTADSLGDYSVEIDVAHSALDEMVKVKAHGVGDQSFVELVSTIGSIDRLNSQTSGDGVLDSSDNFAVNVTNLSTAQTVLIERANDGQSVTNDEAFDRLASEIDSAQLLDLAAAIKLVVDNAEYSLPSDVTTTLELITEAETSQAFIESIQLQDPDALKETIDLIVADEYVTKPLTTENLEGEYYLIPEGNEYGFYYGDEYTNGNGNILEFNQDATGRLITDSGIHLFNWQLADSKYQITLQSPIENPYRWYTPERTTLEASQILTGLSVTRTTSGEHADTLRVELIYNLEVPSISHTQVDTRETSYVALKKDGLIPFIASDLEGVFVGFVPDLVGKSDLLTFNSDGTGSTQHLGESFTWFVTDLGRLIADFETGTSVEYSRLTSAGPNAYNTLAKVSSADGEVISSVANLMIKVNSGLEFVEADVTDSTFYSTEKGIQHSTHDFTFGYNYYPRYVDGQIVNLFRNQNDKFDLGFHFFANGEAFESGDLIGSIWGTKMPTSFDPNARAAIPTYWTVDEGKIVIDQYYNIGTGDQLPCDNQTDSNCWNFHLEMQLVALEDNRIFVFYKRTPTGYGPGWIYGARYFTKGNVLVDGLNN